MKKVILSALMLSSLTGAAYASSTLDRDAMICSAILSTKETVSDYEDQGQAQMLFDWAIQQKVKRLNLSSQPSDFQKAKSFGLATAFVAEVTASSVEDTDTAFAIQTSNLNKLYIKKGCDDIIKDIAKSN